METQKIKSTRTNRFLMAISVGLLLIASALFVDSKETGEAAVVARSSQKQAKPVHFEFVVDSRGRLLNPGHNASSDPGC